MEKKIYQQPNTEQIYVNMSGHVLDWSAPWDQGGGNIPEAKQIVFEDDYDFFEDEEIEPVWSFNVWE